VKVAELSGTMPIIFIREGAGGVTNSSP